MSIRKRMNVLFGTLLLTGSLFSQNVCVSTPETSLVLSAPVGGELKHVYYGDKLSEVDLQNINLTGTPDMPAYPVYGLNCPGESALAVKHADGNMTLQMEIVQVKTSKEENAEITAIELKDKVYPFYVNVYYKAYQDADVIEIWTEIRHQEKKPVILNQFASAFLPIRRGNVWLSHLYGSWANEGRLCQEALEPGMKVIKNKDGVRNSHTSHAEVMFSLDGKPQENAGCVIGAALCYSGNYKLRIDTHDDEYHRFFAGINEENSAYSLKKDEIFRTPELALTYSNEGLSGSSRNFHRWARLHKLAHGTVPRKILLNSWEGVYFDVNQAGMDQMMSDIASMGGELFVMDDGWFGDKYPRKNDSSSLGDWVVDKNKLPNGIEGLLKDAQKNGVKFGIWIEPEMVNPKSELFEKHPEWVIKLPNRETYYYRHQLVLDLSNPKVQDYVYNVVADILKENPETAFFKWDCNSPITNIYSPYLKEKQGQLYIDHVRGIYNVMKRVKANYPDVPMMLCSGGGARCDYEALKYFTEFWCSDNTDPIERIYIQWGFSQFFPAKAMCAHVTGWNKSTSVKFRTDVASMCKLGFDLGLKELSADELAYCQTAVTNWKRLQAAIMDGVQYRLVSPYQSNHMAVNYVSRDTDKAVLFAYDIYPRFQEKLMPVRLQGLNPDKRYKVEEINLMPSVKSALKANGKIYSGDYLMKVGLDVFGTAITQSHVIELTAQ